MSDYEEYGCTYTIALPDGRSKYFVEEDELRLPTFLKPPGTKRPDDTPPSQPPPPPPLPDAPPPAALAGLSPPPRTAAPERVMPAELSDSSDDEPERGKFGVGASVEVLRNDGMWTLATVRESNRGPAAAPPLERGTCDQRSPGRAAILAARQTVCSNGGRVAHR